jgi:putative membrane protein
VAKQLMARAALVSAAILTMCGVATAGPSCSSSSDQQAHATRAATTARSFIRYAVEDSLEQVVLGELAQQKASSAEVKLFGQQMVDDYGTANRRLKQVAERNEVTVPADFTRAEKSEYRRLAGLPGAQFDRAYMNLMLRDERCDVAALEGALRRAYSAGVTRFAASALRAVRAHLVLARRTAASVDNDTRATTGAGRAIPTGTTGTSGSPGSRTAPRRNRRLAPP